MESCLPLELKLDIVRRLGHGGFMRLAPILVAGKEGRDAALAPEVLKEVGLQDFFISPYMALRHSDHRPFLLKCLRHGNIMAKYVEGVRILREHGESREAYEMLNEASDTMLHAVFASGVFLICAGSYEAGMGKLSDLWDKVGSLKEALKIADTVVCQIALMGLLGRSPLGIYRDTFSYPELPGCLSSGACYGSNICRICYALRYACVVSAVC